MKEVEEQQQEGALGGPTAMALDTGMHIAINWSQLSIHTTHTYIVKLEKSEYDWWLISLSIS